MLRVAGRTGRVELLVASATLSLCLSTQLKAGPPCDMPTVQTNPMRAVNAALDFARDDREVRMAVDASTGAIVVAWAVNQTLGTDYDLFFARSSDGGANWSAPAALNSNASTDTVTDQFPSIAAGGGTFVAVWESTSGAGTDFDIRFTRSADGGQTWSAVAPLNTNAATDANNDHDRNARIATDGDGTWICVWDSNDPSGGTTGFDQDVFFSKSTDDGANWSAPALVDTAGGSDSTFDSFARIGSDGDDGWVAVWADALTNGMQVMWSDSDGDSWTLAPGIVDPGSNAYSVAGAPDGTWLIASRKLVGDSDVFIYQSADGGMTWSSPIRPVPDDLVNPNDDENPWVAIDSEGVAVVAWRSDEPYGGGLGFDPEIVMCASTDAGLTWGPPTSINGGVLDSQFSDEEPMVAALGDGEWMVAWKSTNALNGTIGTDYDVIVAKAEVLIDADCNNNRVSDGCEIINTPTNDRDNDGILDVCQTQSFPNASLTEVLRTGDPAPGGGSYGGNFGMPRCKGDPEAIVFTPNAQLVVNESGVDTILVAGGDPAPGTPTGVVFRTFPSPFNAWDMNAQQQVAFEGVLTGTGVNSSNDNGLWFASSRGVELIAREGDQAPGFPPGVLLVTEANFSNPAINDAGTVVQRLDLIGPGITSGNDRALWRWQAGATVLIMQKGSPAPGTAFNFNNPSSGHDIDNDGTSFFSSSLLSTSGQGIWRVPAASTTPIEIAVPGMPAPGLPLGVTFSDAFLARVAANGTIAFTAQLAGTGVTSANDSTLWTWNGGLFTLIAREGNATPGTLGLQWSAFSPAAISPGGRLVFAARSTGSAGEDEALWIMTATGPKVIVRTWTPALGTFPPTFFGPPLTGFYVVSVNDDADAIIGWEAGIYGWRENYGLFFIASDNASALIDDVPHSLVTTFLPPRSTGITAAPNSSRNLTSDGSFVFQATYLEPPLNAWAFIRGTLPELADLTGDTCVDVNDLLKVITQWGPCVSTPCTGDGTHDGIVDVNDLLLVITNWGCDGGS